MSEILINSMQGTYLIKRPLSIDFPIRADIIVKKQNDLSIIFSIPPNNKMEGIFDISPRPRIKKKFIPLKDAYINESVPTLNYGYRGQMRVGKDIDGIRYRSFLLFDFSELENNLNIISAKLKLNIANQSYSIDMFEISTLNKKFDEYGVTWANQPTREQFIDIIEIPKYQKEINIDVTNTIKDWYTNNRINNGFVVKEFEQNLNKEISFFTKESGENFAPILEIEYFDPTFSLPKRNFFDINFNISTKENIFLPINFEVITYKKEVNLPIGMFVKSVKGELWIEFNVTVPRIPIKYTILTKEEDFLPLELIVSQFRINDKTEVNFVVSHRNLPIYFNPRVFNDLFVEFWITNNEIPIDFQIIEPRHVIPIEINIRAINELPINFNVSVSNILIEFETMEPRHIIPLDFNVKGITYLPVDLTVNQISLPLNMLICSRWLNIDFNVRGISELPITMNVKAINDLSLNMIVGKANYIFIDSIVLVKPNNQDQSLPIYLSWGKTNIPINLYVRQYNDLAIEFNVFAYNDTDVNFIVLKKFDSMKPVNLDVRAISILPIDAYVHSRFLDINMQVKVNKQTFKNIYFNTKAVSDLYIDTFVRKKIDISIFMNVKKIWFSDLPIKVIVNGDFGNNRAYVFIM